jgi:hypothetical protein
VCGCGKKPTEDAKADGGASQQARKPLGKEPAAIAETLVKDTYPDCEILAKKDTSITYKNNPATAVHIRFKVKGENEEKNWIILVQDGISKDQDNYDTNKSLEENAKALAAKGG